MKIVILDGYAANPGDLDYHLLEELGEVVVYPRTSDEEKVERAKDAKRTDEIAVMIDTKNPLVMTQEAEAVSNDDYWKSWRS